MGEFLVIEQYQDLQLHPYCLAIPEMDDAEYQELKVDISASGLLEPITIFAGQILDGRHRFRACLELEIDPWFVQFDGPDSPMDFVISKNLKRRQLSKGQKEIAWARLCTLQRGSNRFQAITIEGEKVDRSIELSTNDTKSIEKAAKEAGTSEIAIKRARQVVQNGSDELIKAVESDKVAVSAAAEVVKVLPDKELQSEAVKAAAEQPRKIVEVAKEIAKQQEEKKGLGHDAILATDWQEGMALCVPTDKQFNKQDNDSIGWAAYSWNPITGCNLGCDYCYARDIAERFYDKRIGFKPALHPDRLLIPYNKQPKAPNNRVFVCSMADLFAHDVPKAWIDEVLRVCAKNPQFEFLLLTKQPKRLLEFSFPVNCWVGATTDNQQRMDTATRIFEQVDATKKWLSVEPMFERIIPSNPGLFDWYAIGGASSNTQQSGFIPNWEWVFELSLIAKQAGSKVWIKDNFWKFGRPMEM